MCNCFLPLKDNDPYHICTLCQGKMCGLNDCCEECHDWCDECCLLVGECMAKLSVQREQKHERKAKASSSFSSFSGFSPAMPVPLCQLPSPSGSGVVTTTHSLTVCSVTFLAAAPVVSSAPFVAPLEVAPVEPDRKQRHVDLPQDRAAMLAAFEYLWANRRCSDQHPSPCPGLSLAPSPGSPPSSCSSPSERSRSCVVSINPGPVWP